MSYLKVVDTNDTTRYTSIFLLLWPDTLENSKETQEYKIPDLLVLRLP